MWTQLLKLNVLIEYARALLLCLYVPFHRSLSLSLSLSFYFFFFVFSFFLFLSFFSFPGISNGIERSSFDESFTSLRIFLSCLSARNEFQFILCFLPYLAKLICLANNVCFYFLSDDSVDNVSRLVFETTRFEKDRFCMIRLTKEQIFPFADTQLLFYIHIYIWNYSRKQT